MFGQECHAAGFKLTNRWMLIGSAEYDFNGKTVAEVTAWLVYMIDEVADAINWTMHKLDERTRFVTGCEADVSEPSGTQAVLEEEHAVAPIIAEAVADCDPAVSEPSGTPALLEENPRSCGTEPTYRGSIARSAPALSGIYNAAMANMR
jgi:hypothetical protein